MEISDYLLELQGKLQTSAQNCTQEQPLVRHFADYVKELLMHHNYIEEYEYAGDELTAAAQGPFAAYRIDGYYIPDDADDDHIISLYSFDFSSNEGLQTITNGDLRKLFKAQLNFIQMAAAGNYRNMNEFAKEQAKKVKALFTDNNQVKVRQFVFSNRKFGATFKPEDYDSKPDYAYEQVVFDLDQLFLLEVGQVGSYRIDVDFHNDFTHLDDFAKSIDCVKADGPEEGCISSEVYLGAIPGMLLADLYGRHGQKLMESNVRAYLQDKGKVNRGIRHTASSMPTSFVAFNNGICCTAEEVEECSESEQVRIKSIKNLQIVNGGQTTATLYQTLNRRVKSFDARNNLKKVVVPFKLIVVRNKNNMPQDNNTDMNFLEKSRELVANISTYSNSQNSINNFDLKSQNPYLLDLEQISKKTVFINNGVVQKYYFERVRGGYKTELLRLTQTKERNMFEQQNPENNKFDTTLYSRVETITLLRPYDVAAGKQSCFTKLLEQFESIEPIINEGYYRSFVGRLMLYRVLEGVVKTIPNSLGTRNPIIYYSMSWLMAKFGHQIDWQKIADQQCIPAELFNNIISSEPDSICLITIEELAKFAVNKNPSFFAKKATWELYMNAMEKYTGLFKQKFNAILDKPGQAKIIACQKHNFAAKWKTLVNIYEQKVKDHKIMQDASLDYIMQITGVSITLDNTGNYRLGAMMRNDWAQISHNLGIANNDKKSERYIGMMNSYLSM